MIQRISYIIILFLFSCGKTGSVTVDSSKYTPLNVIKEWSDKQVSNKIVCQQGTVEKILPDDHEGKPHQRFILRLRDDITLLISHNIELAQRIPDLKNGDLVIFKGEYEWNKKGGVVHWTHHDPKGRHQDGYLIHNGTKYN